MLRGGYSPRFNTLKISAYRSAGVNWRIGERRFAMSGTGYFNYRRETEALCLHPW
jgi:hypothetical protein